MKITTKPNSSQQPQKGATMLEYTILIAFIALATMLAVRPVGETVGANWKSAADALAVELPY
jgi:Flp pilus assembly pilin Flp